MRSERGAGFPLKNTVFLHPISWEVYFLGSERDSELRQIQIAEHRPDATLNAWIMCEFWSVFKRVNGGRWYQGVTFDEGSKITARLPDLVLLRDMSQFLSTCELGAIACWVSCVRSARDARLNAALLCL